jgi:hypothetical protein
MKVKKYGSFFFIVLLLLLSLSALSASVGPLQAQTATGALHGQVTDPSGAAIAGASVIMTPAAAGSPIVVQSDAQGLYDFKTLPSGKYTLTVAATGFTLYENDNVVIATQALRLNVTMTIEVETTKVQVSDTAPTVDVNPSNNAGAIVISGKEAAIGSRSAGRALRRPQRRADVYRRLHRRPASAQVIHSRDPH